MFLRGLALILVAVSAHCAHAAPTIRSGPMVVASTPDSLTVWLQADGPCYLALIYDIDYALAYATLSPPVDATGDTDYCASVTIADLNPDTRYFYRVLVNGRAAESLASAPIFAARTAPLAPGKYRVAVASFETWRRAPDAPVWAKLAALNVDRVFWTDVARDPVSAEDFQEHHRADVLRPMLAAVPNLARWDDSLDASLADPLRRYWRRATVDLPLPPPSAAVLVAEMDSDGGDEHWVSVIAYDDDGTVVEPFP